MFFFWIVALFSATAVHAETLFKIAHYDEAFKQYPQNPKLVDEFMTPDAIVCFEDICAPYREVFDSWFDGVKVFDYIQVVHGEGQCMLTGRCYDYMEYHSGCSTMFSVDWIMQINEKGKVLKYTAILDEEQAKNGYKCAPGDSLSDTYRNAHTCTRRRCIIE